MKEFGLQLFSVRSTMDTAENIRMTFRRLREMGYTQVQTAGCNIPYEEYGRIAAEDTPQNLLKRSRGDKVKRIS